MNKLTKSDIGLGEVRNRITPSIEEYEMLLHKINDLNLTEEIVGVLSTLSNDPKVELGVMGEYIIDMNKVRRVKISVDENGRRIYLTGGLQGKPITFEFMNRASHDILWGNLRVSGGLNPGLSILPAGSQAPYATTIYVVTRLGNEYYLLNQIHEIK